MKSLKQKLSIVIPVYCSENTITEVVRRIVSTLEEKIDYEILLINDGSPDNSYKICKALTEQYDFVKLIDLSKNFGQHNAIFAGLRSITGDYIICIDDDLQTPPEEIWKLISKLEDDYDVVYAKYIEKKHNLFKRMGSRLNSSMLNTLMRKPKSLSLSSYFIAKRFIIDEIIKYEGPNPYIWGLILRSTNRISNVDVAHNERKHGKTGYGIIKLIRLFLNGFINFSILPLRVLFISGSSLAFLSLIGIIIIIVQKILDPGIAIGWTSTAAIILFFSGINLISIGLLGEYIGRSFMHQSKQSQYLIREKINFEKRNQI